jgi:hypothetical protein
MSPFVTAIDNKSIVLNRMPAGAKSWPWLRGRLRWHWWIIILTSWRLICQRRPPFGFLRATIGTVHEKNEEVGNLSILELPTAIPSPVGLPYDGIDLLPGEQDPGPDGRR